MKRALKHFSHSLTKIVSQKATLCVICFVVVATLLSGCFGPPMNRGQVEKYFERNKELILLATGYLFDFECDSIFISSSEEEGYMYISGTEGGKKRIQIDNPDAAMSIATLRGDGYTVISKDKGVISYKCYPTMLSKSYGFAYSGDGSKPTVQFITKLEWLSEPDWYYFETDYEKWRSRNSS